VAAPTMPVRLIGSRLFCHGGCGRCVGGIG
jgi:hypothetical protein